MADVAPRVSECTICPDWVIRCAHLDGQQRFLILVDRREAVAEHGGNPYFVLTALGYSKHEEEERELITTGIGLGMPPPDDQDFPDLPSAQAEFRRREEELLRPEQPAPPPTPQTP